MREKFTLKMTVAEFKKYTGYEPINDDLDRVNCKEVGTIGHSLCGWCFIHNLPRLQCGCRIREQSIK